MAIEILMPKLSDTMEEGKILKWLKQEGDKIESGDIVAEIETDKADMEFEVIDDGILLKILAPEGSTAPVGELIAVIGEEGEDVSGYSAGDAIDKNGELEDEDGDDAVEEDSEETEEEPSEKEEPAEEPAEEEKEESKEESSEEAEEAEEKEDKDDSAEEDRRPASEGAVKASPVARRLADENGIDISELKGSGPDGRVVKRDVEAKLGGKAPARKEEQEEKKESAGSKPERKKQEEKPVSFEPPKTPEARRESMSGMRKTIAKRLVQSKVEVPHFYLGLEIDAANLIEARESVKEQDGYKISINDFIVKACASALLSHPMVNAYIDEDEIVYNDTVDVGVAVALDEGLITPYVRAAHKKGLGAIAQEVKDLAARARNRKLKPEEYSGGSMTISNLGMFGIDAFTAIINPPESTILAVGRIREVPVVQDGEIRVGQRLRLTLSCDHRIVDGAVGARFLATLKHLLENPMQLLV